MKKLIVLFVVILNSCISQPVPIGQVNMISNRNISSDVKYELLQKFSGSGKKQLVRSNAKTITDAIDNVVKAVPGGEYLMNAKLYKLGAYYAAEGDVWGTSGQTDINGFRPNGIAYYKRKGKLEKVTVVSFVDSNKINVVFDDGKHMVVDRSWLVASSD